MADDQRVSLAEGYCEVGGFLGALRTPWCGLAALAGTVSPAAENVASEAGATAREVVPATSASVASAATASAVSAGMGTVALGLGALGVAALVGVVYMKAR